MSRYSFKESVKSEVRKFLAVIEYNRVLLYNFEVLVLVYFLFPATLDTST